MSASQNSAAAVGPRRWRSRIFTALVCLALALALTAFLEVGRWLVVEDPVAHASAIVVLGGAMPLRAMEAAKLYRQGYAREVWLTHSKIPAEALAAMGIHFDGEEYYDSRILVHEGVPPNAIHVLDPPIVNTVDEIQVIDTALAKQNGRSIILVTSKAHTRRARLLWRKLASRESRAIVRAATEDPFDPAHWWRNTNDALEVVREVLGLMNAWAGLPLAPAR